MIVVDGSGSMAGLIEPKGRQSKIGLVREGLLEALSQAGPQTRVGLAAFGHRSGGCRDAEILRPPERPDVERVMAPLARIRPRGKGALVFALREAAKQLPETAVPRSLVLIHDGLDNCQQDVCAAASDLAAAGITAHVVSLGLNADDLGKMACLAQTTGGRLFNVDSSDQVSGAIVEAVRLASGELTTVGLASPATASDTPWATSLIPPVPVPASRPAALQLTALPAAGAEPLAFPLHWTVARADEPDTTLFDAFAANPVIPLAPGDYAVTAAGDLVSASQTVTVREGRTMRVPIVLGAGTARVRVAGQRNNAALPDAIITVSTGDGTPVAVFKASEAQALLAPGRYRISAELGLVRSEQTVAIVQGRPAFVDLALDVGRLQLTAAARVGAAEGALFIVMEDDPPRGRREVARSAASQADFALPPGTYYVIARQGSIEARERLEIGSGDIVRRTLTAATGRLGSSSDAPASGRIGVAAGRSP
jgi:Ca-activated chloride channel family protein